MRSLIIGTKNNELIWEIPKGRKNKRETSLDCAIREFKEETNIDTDSYNIMFDIKPIVESFVSLNITYVHNYFIAYTSKSLDTDISFGSQDQISEVSDIKWVGMDEIKFVDHTGRLQKLVQRIFHVFKSKYKHCKHIS